MIEYLETTEDITSEMLTGFFEGWPNPPSPETHLEILQKSAFIVIALEIESNRVVGFINAISDGILAAYIPLLEVLPEFRKQGIGQELAKRMIDRLGNFYMVDLICDEKLKPFYERFEMQPVSGMVIRNFKRQSGK